MVATRLAAIVVDPARAVVGLRTTEKGPSLTPHVEHYACSLQKRSSDAACPAPTDCATRGPNRCSTMAWRWKTLRLGSGTGTSPPFKHTLSCVTADCETLRPSSSRWRAEATPTYPTTPAPALDQRSLRRPSLHSRSPHAAWPPPSSPPPAPPPTPHQSATGLRRLVDLTHGGFRTSAVHLLVDKPGRAKTQMATQIAVNVATGGVPAADPAGRPPSRSAPSRSDAPARWPSSPAP